MTENSRIAVYGATGYTGRLIVRELHRQGIQPVLVGRDADRLRAVAGPDGLVREAGLDDPGAQAEALAGCDALISSVAPFTRWGEPLVRAALAAGVHYVDVSGEQAYVKRVFDAFAQDAVRAGVSVVCAATDTGLGDPLAHLTAARVGAVEELTIGHLVAMAQPSRGTLRAVLEIAAGDILRYADGEWRAGPTGTSTLLFPGMDEPSPVVGLAATEVVTVPRHVKAQRVEGVIDAQVVAALAALTPEVVEQLPSGPAEEARRADTFTLAVEATGTDGRRARGIAQGHDVYGTTAVVAVEAARRLATQGAPAGVLALAEAFAPEDFLNSLTGHGVRWSVSEV